jgi:hypothetical protein
MQKTETRSISFAHTSVNLKQIKDFNIRPDTLRLVQERTRNILEIIVTGNDFVSRTQVAQQLKERLDKMGLYEIKNLLHNKINGL